MKTSRISPARILRSLALSAIVAALTAAVVYVTSYLLFPVTGLQVEGARMFPESEAWKALPEHASLLTLNTRALEREIKSNPWVESVGMSKDWDSGIVMVKVEERRPVLYAELGSREVVMATGGTELPSLGGARLEKVRLEGRRLEEILGAGRVLERSGLEFESVDEVGPEGVRATVAGRPVIFGGSVSEGQASTLAGVMEEHPEAPLFDLRSPGRVVVGVGKAWE